MTDSNKIKKQMHRRIKGINYFRGIQIDEEFYHFIRKTRRKVFTPSLKQGDMYIFSASRVHELFSVIGSKQRIVMACFAAWHDNDDAVLHFL